MRTRLPSNAVYRRKKPARWAAGKSRKIVGCLLELPLLVNNPDKTGNLRNVRSELESTGACRLRPCDGNRHAFAGVSQHRLSKPVGGNATSIESPNYGSSGKSRRHEPRYPLPGCSGREFEIDFLWLVAALRYPLVGPGLGHGLLEIIFPFPLKSLLMFFEVGDLPQNRGTFHVRRISRRRVC
jgi:hypothetical protein